MNENYAIAGKGLKRVFSAQILAGIGTVLLLFPAINAIGIFFLIASGIVNLIGLINASPAHPGYKNALYVTERWFFVIWCKPWVARQP